MALMDTRLSLADGPRGTGETRDMVMALPAGGACVIVHSGSLRRYVERMIFDLRGKDFLKLCRVHVIYGTGCLSRLYGLRMPTFVDHAFWDEEHVALSTQANVGAIVRRINAAAPHPKHQNKSANQ